MFHLCINKELECTVCTTRWSAKQRGLVLGTHTCILQDQHIYSQYTTEQTNTVWAHREIQAADFNMLSIHFVSSNNAC